MIKAGEAKVNIKGLKMPKKRISRLLKLTGLALRDIRNERIEWGICVDGRPLLTGPLQNMAGRGGISNPPLSKMSRDRTAQYSPSYERWKRGLTVKRPGSQRMNIRGRRVYSKRDRLVLTGAMINSQKVWIERWNRAILGFSAEEVKKALRNDRMRPFIKFTASEMRVAFQDAVSELGTNRVGKSKK